MTAPEPIPYPTDTFSAEISTLNQHGDPGFRWSRGDFYSRNATAQFVVAQAKIVSELRDAPQVSVEIADRNGTSELSFIGTPTELVTTLSTLPEYSTGVRRAQLPAPPEVLAAVAEASATAPSALDPNISDPTVREVEVLSTRPDPLPNSRTFVGTFDAADAARIADTVAEQLQGSVATGRDDSVLIVTHETRLPAADLAAIDRHRTVQGLRANISTLDPTVEAGHIEQIRSDIDALTSGHRAVTGAAPPVAIDDRPGQFLSAVRTNADVTATSASPSPHGDAAAHPIEVARGPYGAGTDDIGLN